MRSWTQRHLTWVKQAVHFEQPAQEATLLDSVHEVEHVAGRIERLDRAMDDVVKTAPARMRAVIDPSWFGVAGTSDSEIQIVEMLFLVQDRFRKASLGEAASVVACAG